MEQYQSPTLETVNMNENQRGLVAVAVAVVYLYGIVATVGLAAVVVATWPPIN